MKKKERKKIILTTIRITYALEFINHMWVGQLAIMFCDQSFYDQCFF